MTAFILQQLVNAITLGAIYALIALGYTMVYGVLKLINFAHSELFMLGAYVSLAAIGVVGGASGLSGLVALLAIAILVFAAIGLLGVSIETVAYRPLRNQSRLAPMLSALGCAIVIQNAVMLIAGRQPVPYPALLPSYPIEVAGAFFDVRQILILLIAGILMVALHLWVHRTRMGIQIRAVSESHVTARLVGINVDRAIATVFVVGPGLGAIAGILYASHYGVITFTMGFIVGLKAFTAAILGGIGSIPGAMLGGFALGLLEAFGAGFLPLLTNGASGSEYRDIFAFAVLILVLLFRPAGILGEAVSEETMAAKKDF